MFKQSIKSSAGATLLEMMVALLVLSIGLLGVATLQVRGQQFNQVAYFRTQATFLAYDLMERIKINSTLNNPNVLPISYVVDLNASNCPTDVAVDLCDGNNASCVPSSLANYDKVQWCAFLGNTLPGSSTTITWDGASSAYTITIQWKNVVDDPNNQFETRTWTLQI